MKYLLTVLAFAAALALSGMAIGAFGYFFPDISMTYMLVTDGVLTLGWVISRGILVLCLAAMAVFAFALGLEQATRP